MRHVLAPSLLSADFVRLADAIAATEACGIGMLHLDVMDGHFVPNITFGPPVVKSIRKVSKSVLDAHLMVSDPERYYGPFVDAGADVVTVHVEAARDPVALLGQIKARGVRAGIALNPDTPLERVLDAAAVADMVLVMSVFPGFGGQSFMPDVLLKVRELRRLFPNLDIEIDGGIGQKTMAQAVEAGANILVAGNAVYGSGDIAGSIRALQSLLPVAA